MKKKHQQSNQAAKPEKYIREKARKLPIYKCYALNPRFDVGIKNIMVIRQHPHGTFTAAFYFIDTWCTGVKDTIWVFSQDKDTIDDLLLDWSRKGLEMEEIEYVEAHNWIYGALTFAEEAGISPHPDFDITQYILEPDDENIELREYEFGRNGRYCLVVFNESEASKYTPALNSTLGKGNYDLVIRGEDYYDDEEDYGDIFCSGNTMEYTYKGKDYPTMIILNHSEIPDIVRTDTAKITRSQISHVLSLPSDTLREDLHSLILSELGRQFGKTFEQLEDGEADQFVIPNCLMFLANAGNKQQTLPIVLEVLRQSDDILDFNFGDIAHLFIAPALLNVCKTNPSALKPFLLEKGLSYNAKNMVLELLGDMGAILDDIREEIISMTREILVRYTSDLPRHTICDSIVAAFAVGVAVTMGARELLPEIEAIYATGLVAESVEGPLDDIRENIQQPSSYVSLPPNDAYAIQEEYTK